MTNADVIEREYFAVRLSDGSLMLEQMDINTAQYQLVNSLESLAVGVNDANNLTTDVEARNAYYFIHSNFAGEFNDIFKDERNFYVDNSYEYYLKQNAYILYICVVCSGFIVISVALFVVFLIRISTSSNLFIRLFSYVTLQDIMDIGRNILKFEAIHQNELVKSNHRGINDVASFDPDSFYSNTETPQKNMAVRFMVHDSHQRKSESRKLTSSRTKLFRKMDNQRVGVVKKREHDRNRIISLNNASLSKPPVLSHEVTSCITFRST